MVIFSKPPNPHADSNDLYSRCLFFVFAMDDEEVRELLIIIIIIIIIITPTLIRQTDLYI